MITVYTHLSAYLPFILCKYEYFHYLLIIEVPEILVILLGWNMHGTWTYLERDLPTCRWCRVHESLKHLSKIDNYFNEESSLSDFEFTNLRISPDTGSWYFLTCTWRTKKLESKTTNGVKVLHWRKIQNLLLPCHLAHTWVNFKHSGNIINCKN